MPDAASDGSTPAAPTRRPDQRVDAHRQQAALLHLLQHSVLGDRNAGMPDRREARLVQLLVVRDAIVDLLLGRSRRRRRQTHQRLRRIDQLAVQSAVRVLRDAATGRLGGLLVDLPVRERRRIEDVFVAAAHEDDRILRRDAIEIVAQRQALLLQLRLMPVAVRDDDVARLGRSDAGLQWRRSHRRSIAPATDRRRARRRRRAGGCPSSRE